MLQRWVIFICVIAVTLAGLRFYTKYKANHSPSAANARQKIILQNQKAIDWIKTHTTWYQRGNDPGWAGFDRVYFISLEERLDNVKQVAQRLGIENSASILKAIHKKNLDVNQLVNDGLVDTAFLATLSPQLYGYIGCQLSHLAVMLDCFNDPKAQTCVIFEDDVLKPAKTITTQLLDFHSSVKKSAIDWDVLYLDYCYEKNDSKTVGNIRILQDPLCCHAYVIKKKMIPKYLAISVPMRMTNDISLGYLVKNKEIVALGPAKARYFAQGRTLLGSIINPNLAGYEDMMSRFQH